MNRSITKTYPSRSERSIRRRKRKRRKREGERRREKGEESIWGGGSYAEPATEHHNPANAITTRD
jgi:hypothetical protein